MLESKDRMVERSGLRTSRWATGVLLAAVALGLAMVPNPLLGDPPAVAVRKAMPTADIPSFDLSYIPADAMGIYAIRVSQVFERAGMDEPGRALLKGLAENQAKLGDTFVRFWRDHPLKPEQIEQLIGAIRLGRTRNQGKELRSFGTTGIMVRTNDPYDWNGLIRAIWPDATEYHSQGKTYLKVKSSYFAKDDCFFVADERTLVQERESALLSVLRRREPAAPPFTQRDSWKDVERGLVAVVLDNGDGRIQTATKRDDAADKGDGFASFAHIVDRVYFKLEPSDDLSFRLMANPHHPQDTDTLLDLFVQFQDYTIKSCLSDEKPEDLSPEELRLRGLFAAVMRSISATREPSGLRFINRPTMPGAAVKLSEFLPLFVREGL
ncbi:hypothetical protein [Aquisphaera insulae]|uniref:hypothetical protein n=1 Tax=Aquisphaera insulae TaxID=2712864 RepID=UPI00202EF4BC|nr:hypothetical protein [Aquisphaera insulae]